MTTPPPTREERLERALRFYADPNNYKMKQRHVGPMGSYGIEWQEIIMDGGKLAQSALRPAVDVEETNG